MINAWLKLVDSTLTYGHLSFHISQAETTDLHTPARSCNFICLTDKIVTMFFVFCVATPADSTACSSASVEQEISGCKLRASVYSDFVYFKYLPYHNVQAACFHNYNKNANSFSFKI